MKILKGFFLILILSSTLIVYQVYDSSWYMALLLNDFNVSKYYDRPIAQIEQIPDKFPNISLTTIPLKAAKSNYYIKQRKFEEAKNLLYESMNDNPFLGINESNLSEIFYLEKLYDSAVYYAEIAVNKLPNNPRHIINLQRGYTALKEDKKLDSIYNLYKYKENITYHFFQNHFLFLTNAINEYSKHHKNEIKYSVKRFPQNKMLKVYEKIIVNGNENISLSNESDKIAFQYFKEKKYDLAIENWKNAIDILPTEDSYYLNIAQSLILLRNYNEANFYLEQALNSDIIDKPTNGKLEFLKGMIFYENEKNKLACSMFSISSSKKYKLASRLLKELKCI